MLDDLKKIETEYQTILQQLSSPELISNWGEVDEPSSSPRFANARVFDELIKRKVYLEKIIEKEKEIEEIKNKIEENKVILKIGRAHV